jgi:general secretion pathway protein G
MRAQTAQTWRHYRGFTLIEIMVVVVIIGILASLVGPAVMRQLDRAQISAAQTDIKSIDAALGMFRMEHYRYPTEDEGLLILTGVAPPGSEIDESRLGPVIKGEVPKDPWNREFLYRYPGEHGEYDIFTLGADGEEGGEGVNADIGNWTDDEVRR